MLGQQYLKLRIAPEKHMAIFINIKYKYKYMTIISIKHKFIILLNPKCAGTYIQYIFNKYHDFPIKIYKHNRAEKVKMILEKYNYNWNDFYIIIVIRNPFEHAISSFYQDLILYKKISKTNKKYGEKYLNKINIYKNNINKYIKNEELRHFPGIKYMICDQDNICLVNKIFKISEINNLIDHIKNKYDLNIKTIKKKINKTLKKEYTIKNLNDDTINIIKKIYSFDILIFNDQITYKKYNKI
jgi:hypothetical protein